MLQGAIIIIVSWLGIPTLAQIPVTAIGQWPGYTNQRSCGQCAFGNYGCPGVDNVIGCYDDWTCVCNHESMAQTTLLGLVSSLCSNNAQDIVLPKPNGG